jgi:hypothetical protein
MKVVNLTGFTVLGNCIDVLWKTCMRHFLKYPNKLQNICHEVSLYVLGQLCWCTVILKCLWSRYFAHFWEADLRSTIIKSFWDDLWFVAIMLPKPQTMWFFFKFKSVKHNAYEAHPHSVEELKEDICRKGFSLSQEQIYYTKSLEALRCNEMFSGRQLCQDFMVFRCFKDWLRPHLQGVAGGLVVPKPTLCCVYLCSAQAWYRMQPLWLVGGVKRALHLAWTVDF